MSPAKSPEDQTQGQLPLNPSPQMARPNGLLVIFDDGMMNIGISLQSGVRLEMGHALNDAESEPEYSSEAIDRGEFGALYHPATGQKLSHLHLKKDPAFSHFVFVEPVSETAGWGGISASERKDRQLPRIGNGMSHRKEDFPLPHWRYNHQTGAKLRK